MIYKNFYNKYKMSAPINSLKNENENENKDNDTVIHSIDSIDLGNDDNQNNNETQNNETQNNETIEENKLSVLLKLGDMVLITDPTNEILNNNKFFVEYIDSNKVKLLNTITLEKTLLPILSDGIIGDGNIETITIISRPQKRGYARQNDLLPGIWINIYFGGEIPASITGKITNIEADMIEIKTTDNDTLYINFNYQGIPEILQIESIEIRPEIKKPEEPNEIQELQKELQEEPEEIEIEEFKTDMPRQVVKEKEKEKEKNQKIIFDMNDLELGEIIKVKEYVNIDRLIKKDYISKLNQ